MADNKLFGRATIRVNGKTFRQEKGATLDVGGTKRTTKMPVRGRPGYTEEEVPSKLEASVFIDALTSISEIRSWKDVTVSFECDTGQAFVVNGGWQTDTPVVEESDGKVKITIEGPAAEELLG